MKNQFNLLCYCLLVCLPFLLAARLIDPTKPPVQFLPKSGDKSQPKNQTLHLSAIFIYPNRRIAMINGQALTEGSKIGEFTITTITSYTVEVRGPNGEKEVLQLTAPLSVRSPVKE